MPGCPGLVFAFRIGYLFQPLIEIRRFDNFNLIAPGVQMPGHFQQAAGFEANRQAAVGVDNILLRRMKTVLGGVFGGFGGKQPFRFKRFFPINPERVGGKISQRKFFVTVKIVVADRNFGQAVQGIIAVIFAVIGKRQSRPKASAETLGPGGLWRRLYSFL